jgi:methionyl-tRNA formyltransferase
MLRIVFMGTPEFSVPTLAEIFGAGHDIAAVYTRPPRRAGRSLEEKKSPVQLFAEAQRIQVLHPSTLRSTEGQAAFAAHNADAAVVVAYGLILPKSVLDATCHGCFNLHASLLPRWRGAAPIQRAIMAGDVETGATVMRMDEGLDTGPVCLAERVSIGPNMRAGELQDLLSRQGASLMLRALAALERGSLQCTVQSVEGVNYAAKLDKSETRIDFRRPARVVHNQIRGLSPYPGAWFEAGNPDKRERIKVLRSALMEGKGAPGTLLDGSLTVACGDGAVRMLDVQRAGKRTMSSAEFLRGFPLAPSSLLG